MILINTIYTKLRANAGALYPYLFVFTAAFVLRFIAWKIFGTLFNAKDGDSIEYYITSINFEPHNLFKAMWGYEHWYERTPAYIIFLNLIDRNIIIQIAVSSLSCALMYKMNKFAGILWLIYPQEIIHSFQYNKECLLIFLIIYSIYYWGRNNYKLIIIFPLLILCFGSFAWITNGHHTVGSGMMKNFWSLWQPSFNLSIGYSKIFVYIQFIPYIISMLYFIRNVKIYSVEFLLFIVLSIVYSVVYAEPRFREPFMPLLFLFCAPAVENAYYRLRNIIFNKQKFDFKGIFKKYILHPSP